MIITVYNKDGKVTVTRKAGKNFEEKVIISDLEPGKSIEIDVNAHISISSPKLMDCDTPKTERKTQIIYEV